MAIFTKVISANASIVVILFARYGGGKWKQYESIILSNAPAIILTH